MENAPVSILPHAAERLEERGATVDEVIAAVESGETFPVKHGRTGFRRNFPFDSVWRGRNYATKQIEAIAVYESGQWLVITVLVKFF